MKTQKLLVIAAFVCLMAFLNVSTFAQTAQAQPDPGPVMIRFVAQSLRAQGYDVWRFRNSLKIENQIIVTLPYTLQDLENWPGVRVRLVPKANASAEDMAEFGDRLFSQADGSAGDLGELKSCLGHADGIFNLNVPFCELHLSELGDFTCKIGAITELVVNDLKCLYDYLGLEDQPPPSGPVVSVFVTSDMFRGNLGGLAGADAICQETAEAANLPGTDWTAWLSDSTGNAIDRIPDGQYRLVDGTQVADDKADLTDDTGPKVPINLDESGIPVADDFVWTGTEPDGTATTDPGNNCNNWTDGSSRFSGDRGNTVTDDDGWTKILDGEALCNDPNYLYCFGGVE